MIEDSTRPNIVIYSTFVDSITYIVIKNFGSSPAIIDKVTCGYEFTKQETGDFEGDIFSKVRNANLAPNQSIRCPLVGWRLQNTAFDFTIKYHSSTHSYTYSEKCHVDIISDSPFANMNASKGKTDDILQNIYITLLEMLKRKL